MKISQHNNSSLHLVQQHREWKSNYKWYAVASQAICTGINQYWSEIVQDIETIELIIYLGAKMLPIIFFRKSCILIEKFYWIFYCMNRIIGQFLTSSNKNSSSIKMILKVLPESKFKIVHKCQLRKKKLTNTILKPIFWQKWMEFGSIAVEVKIHLITFFFIQ